MDIFSKKGYQKRKFRIFVCISELAAILADCASGNWLWTWQNE